MIVRARPILGQLALRPVAAAQALRGETADEAAVAVRAPGREADKPSPSGSGPALTCGGIALIGQVYAQHWRERDERRRLLAAARAYGLKRSA